MRKGASISLDSLNKDSNASFLQSGIVTQHSLFAPDIDILEDYQLAHSLRRGATMQATNAKVLGPDIDWINCWNTGGLEVVTDPMRVIYSDQKQILETFLCFSLAL